MNQSLDALFEFHECAVFGYIDNLSANSRTIGILLFYEVPRGWSELFQTEAYALLFIVEF